VDISSLLRRMGILAAAPPTQLDLQLLNVAFGQHKFKTSQGAWGWHTVYLFEFSALGDDCYQGQLEMRGLRAGRFSLPPYRI